MRIFWSVAIIALLFTGAASAQNGSGRSGMSTSSPLNNVRAFDELLSLGKCFAESQRKDALAAMATVPGSKEEEKLFKKLFYGERETCLFGGTQMTMSTIYARGTIAEGLLHTEGVPEQYVLAAPEPTEVSDLHGVARCYTSGHRAEVQALLKTKAGSPKEVEAVAALWSDLKTCMPGINARLNAPWIRFLLAEALLRLAPNTTLSGD